MADEQRLASAITEALRMRDQFRADGMAEAEINRAFEAAVRDVWPKGREWHYECERCRDTGLEMFVCKKGQRCDGISTRIDGPKDKPGKYQRLCARDPEGDYEHDYGMACYCRRGSRFRANPRQPSDDLDSAARQPKKPTRFGR